MPTLACFSLVLLALAVLALWADGNASAPQSRRGLWLWVFGAALLSALVSGVVQPLGLLWVLLFAGAVWRYERETTSRPLRVTSAVAALALAAGLMLHRLPGFHNLRVIDAVRFTPDALPFTLYLNFDKTLIGLFVLGWLHPRLRSAADWRTMLRTAAPWAGALWAVLLLLSVASGYVRFAPKFPSESWLWLGVNLGFTCCAEEALFRGFIQAQLAKVWSGFAAGRYLALGVAAVLFGAAHFAGGPAYVVLATVAGAGYGWVYLKTGRIEASILTHFGLNTLHFFLFTYPALAR